MNKVIFFIFLQASIFITGIQTVFSQTFQVSEARVFSATTDKQSLLRSVEVLQEEIERRSGIKMPLMKKVPKQTNQPLIILAIEKDIVRLPLKYQNVLSSMAAIKSEGFKVATIPTDKTVLIIGKDARGLLYGIGRFLRKAEIREAEISIPEISMSSSPRYSLRGHQLGYRPKTNSYDAFSVEQFDQYIRDLALFGANTIEIMPPNTDDEFSNAHMKLPAAEMIVEQSRISDEYGLDVSIWFPNIGSDYTHPDSIQKELNDREEVFASLPRLNSVFVPAGDPGDLEPDLLFSWLKKVAVVLEKHHPEAKIWLSPQAFKPTAQWFNTFFTHVNNDYSWFGGVVFGPWVNMPLHEVRNRVKSSIPIRRYPDITHNFSSQYPVPHWDLAWAATLGRESINPRPFDQKAIHNALDKYAIGSVSYSEGTNDDLNKFVWSDQDWDPETPVIETLRDYGRLFISPDYTEAIAQGLVNLEKNLQGALLTNKDITQTFRQWQTIEKAAPLTVMQNPRFQMGLIRAYFDAYTHRRLLYETELEHEARDILADSTNGTSLERIQKAIQVLERAEKEPILSSHRTRSFALADSLYKSIGAQLTVERHGGKEERGNFIDHIDMPLNDAPWLLSQLAEIAQLKTEKERKNSMHQLLNRTDPGPGGFYDDFGDPASWYRVVEGREWADDPGGLESPRQAFSLRVIGESKRENIPKAWLKQATALYNRPLKIQYDNLDKDTPYTIRIAYTGRFKSNVKLTTEGGKVIHDYMTTGEKEIYEFDIPYSATADGEVTFIWNCREAERGSQVAEIWLIRKTN